MGSVNPDNFDTILTAGKVAWILIKAIADIVGVLG